MIGFGDLKLKLAISVFMSSLNFMLSRVEHVKSFITFGQGLNWEFCLSCNAKENKDGFMHTCMTRISLGICPV